MAHGRRKMKANEIIRTELAALLRGTLRITFGSGPEK
jgi:hypothetical protein